MCVQQTCLDLLERGFNVHILTDGVSSQRQIDRSTAFRRMESAGAFLTTSESIIFELLKSHKSTEFKSVLPILKMGRKNPLAHLWYLNSCMYICSISRKNLVRFIYYIEFASFYKEANVRGILFCRSVLLFIEW